MSSSAALVTGGSSGIGFAIARMLRSEGFELTLAARKPDKLERAASEVDGHAVAADVSEEDDCIRLVAAHRERFGRLDVLVNSAGIRIAAGVDDLRTKHIDLPMGAYSGLDPEEMIQPEDCAEIVRMLLRLTPRARIPEIVIERLESDGFGA